MKQLEQGGEAAVDEEHAKLRTALPLPDQFVYGGAINDCCIGVGALTSHNSTAAVSLVFGGPILLLDFVLSAVADTLILPFSIAEQFDIDRTIKNSEKEPNVPNTGTRPEQ